MRITHLLFLIFLLPYLHIHSQVYGASNIYSRLSPTDKYKLSDLVDKTCRALDSNNLPYFLSDPCAAKGIYYASLYSEWTPIVFDDLIKVLPDPYWQKLRKFENDSNLAKECNTDINNVLDSQRVRFTIKDYIVDRIRIQNLQDSLSSKLLLKDSTVGTNSKLQLNRLYRYIYYNIETNQPAGEIFILLGDSGSFKKYGHTFSTNQIVENQIDHRYIVRGDTLIVESVRLIFSRIHRDYTYYAIKKKSLVLLSYNDKEPNAPGKNKRPVYKRI